MDTLERIRNQRPTLEVATREMKALLKRFSPSADAQRRGYFAQVNQGSYKAIALASTLATQEQREFAQKRLEGWARDLTSLLAKNSSARV